MAHLQATILSNPLKSIRFNTILSFNHTQTVSEERTLRSHPTTDNNVNRPHIQYFHNNPPNISSTETFSVHISPLDFINNNNKDYTQQWTKKWFVNLSSTNISEEVVDLLKLGPNFSLPPVSLNKNIVFQFIKDFENNILKYNAPLRERVRMILVPALDKLISSYHPQKNSSNRTLANRVRDTNLLLSNNNRRDAWRREHIQSDSKQPYQKTGVPSQLVTY